MGKDFLGHDATGLGVIGDFGFQRGLIVASSAQSGFPAWSSDRSLFGTPGGGHLASSKTAR